ncbi:hypothetical protein NDU88_011634 [Pleurodeles waltl]|uniref:Uncharacterized protein n=1 Tax=Pleurodeles waltl TaxID=8319 RepID=A0AAV7Q289_PLEWA|nr:hypothetical protein NDU88_011634 [Pleurodeles waltl]
MGVCWSWCVVCTSLWLVAQSSMRRSYPRILGGASGLRFTFDFQTDLELQENLYLVGVFHQNTEDPSACHDVISA